MTSSRAAGHRRRNLALVVVAASVVSAGGGIVVGRSLQSPADAAAEAAPPEPSRITVPVERRSLVSRLIANGDIQYNEPTPLRLVGSVGASGGSTQIITKVPELDAELAEGDVALEVSGRPVFVFVGELRRLVRSVSKCPPRFLTHEPHERALETEMHPPQLGVVD